MGCSPNYGPLLVIYGLYKGYVEAMFRISQNYRPLLVIGYIIAPNIAGYQNRTLMLGTSGNYTHKHKSVTLYPRPLNPGPFSLNPRPAGFEAVNS